MSPAGHGIILAGTNTEVGKTLAGTVLAAALIRRGLSVRALKPVESGCEPDPEDALTWCAITGQDLERVCPYRFRLPIAPQSAGELEGRAMDLALVQGLLAQHLAEADLTLVETAGGLGSPVAPGTLVLDLARALGLPVLLVAPHTLGSVGQSLVCARLLEHEGIPCAGILLSRTDPGPEGPEAGTHAPLLAEHGRGVPLLGILPHLGAPPPPRPPQQYAAWAAEQAPVVERAIDLDKIISIRDEIASPTVPAPVRVK